MKDIYNRTLQAGDFVVVFDTKSGRLRPETLFGLCVSKNKVYLYDRADNKYKIKTVTEVYKLEENEFGRLASEEKAKLSSEFMAHQNDKNFYTNGKIKVSELRPGMVFHNKSINRIYVYLGKWCYSLNFEYNNHNNICSNSDILKPVYLVYNYSNMIGYGNNNFISELESISNKSQQQSVYLKDCLFLNKPDIVKSIADKRLNINQFDYLYNIDIKELSIKNKLIAISEDISQYSNMMGTHGFYHGGYTNINKVGILLTR